MLPSKRYRSIILSEIKRKFWKKAVATLLMMAWVASVCGALFVSAAASAEELKPEPEALVGVEITYT